MKEHICFIGCYSDSCQCISSISSIVKSSDLSTWTLKLRGHSGTYPRGPLQQNPGTSAIKMSHLLLVLSLLFLHPLLSPTFVVNLLPSLSLPRTAAYSCFLSCSFGVLMTIMTPSGLTLPYDFSAPALLPSSSLLMSQFKSQRV